VPGDGTTLGAWRALGDALVPLAETLVPLVDGRSAMLAMFAAFLGAKRSAWRKCHRSSIL
jgi:hypothetical protein